MDQTTERDVRAARGAVANRSGTEAEAIVARRYERAGHAVADMRWRGRSGEIDLVARDGEGYVFVEVKKARCFARAAESLRPRQVARIMNAALEYLADAPRGLMTDMRFDLALVDGQGRVEVVENAFMQ
jgi:putative endonuclease